MTTYSNYESQNGWVMPGSGRRVEFGPEDWYVDEDGDIWVPCACGDAVCITGDVVPPLYYIDGEGDLWLPCRCGGTGEAGGEA